MEYRAGLIARIEAAEDDFRQSLLRLCGPDLLSVDLTMTQLRALFVLGASGALSAHELADALGVGPTTLTGIVDRLQVRGLVHRIPDGHDRRVRRVDLTEAGRTLLGDVDEVRRAYQRRMFDRLDDDVLSGLATAVEALARVCAEEVAAEGGAAGGDPDHPLAHSARDPRARRLG
ncbi:MarR family winged helix-turn-helix transcriptional regulator [Actinopolymorpha singaporensis]|uniref:MarR family winged helix-turn-helix transcriptional regulator n=1 Tax=Actinopolymorpha singaporensis TaxID=117157 RepID=UPI0015613CCB|nr:MarR family transcriptional regulator [Actinopolymorpha singaporensis]